MSDPRIVFVRVPHNFVDLTNNIYPLKGGARRCVICKRMQGAETARNKRDADRANRSV